MSRAETLRRDKHERALASARVGTTPEQRLAWLITFAGQDLETMTRGELDTAARALMVYIYREVSIPSGAGLDALSLRTLRAVHAVLRKGLEDALRRGRIPVPPRLFEVVWFPVDASDPAGPGHFLRQQTGHAPVAVDALHALSADLVAIGHLFHACPAPAPRGAPEAPCGRWFLARTPRQRYCSPTCFSRARTRAFRAARKKKSRLDRQQGHPSPSAAPYTRRITLPEGEGQADHPA